MSSARERAADLLEQARVSDAPWGPLAAAQSYATLAVADEIRALRETIEPLTKPVLLDAASLVEGATDGD